MLKRLSLLYVVILISMILPAMAFAGSIVTDHSPGNGSAWWTLIAIGSIFSTIGGAIKSVAGAVGGVAKSVASVIPGVGPVVSGGLTLLGGIFKKQQTTVTTTGAAGTTTVSYNQPTATAGSSSSLGGGFFSQKILGVPLWAAIAGAGVAAWFLLRRKRR